MATNEVDELKDEFRIKFEGETHQIDANTFVNYLIHFNTVIQEVNRELAPERKIRVKINALEPGSFDVGIELQSYISQLLGFLSSEKTVSYLNSIMGIISGLIAIKLFLAPTPANVPGLSVQSTDGQTIITLPDGKTLIVSSVTYNIYNTNPIVNQAITKQFETLEQDPNVTGLTLSDNEKRPIANVSREEFSILASNHQVNEPGQRHDLRHTILSIVKLSFDPKLKSDFIYMNIRISAAVKDKAFYELINQGKSFAKGDALEVKLQVNLAFDPSVDTEVIKSYEVVEVMRHIPRNDPNQLQLNLRPETPA